jgi:hypothetical protein
MTIDAQYGGLSGNEDHTIDAWLQCNARISGIIIKDEPSY